MTRIISRLIYHSIYSFLYLLPLFVLMFGVKVLNLDLSKYFDLLGPLKPILGLFLLAYAILLPGYRAKLASDAYGDRDMKFWEAHFVSGAILKTHLSFLPIIGRFFIEKK